MSIRKRITVKILVKWNIMLQLKLKYHVYKHLLVYILKIMLSEKSKIQNCTHNIFQFSSVQSLSRVRLFVTPWTVACQALSVLGIFQATILEWVAITFSRGSS